LKFQEDDAMDQTPMPLELLDDPATCAADAQAIEDFVEKGRPLDPAIAARVRARADRAREANFQRLGFVNLYDLLHPSQDDE
jgi:hypothetical protein